MIDSGCSPLLHSLNPALTNGQVTAVHAGGLAESAGLRVNDKITEVNRQDAGVQQLSKLLPKDKMLPITLKVVRLG